MSLTCFGLSYQTAPLALLEGLSFSTGQLECLLADLAQQPEIREAAAISTCNRTEFYLVAQDPASAREVVLDQLRRHAPNASLEKIRQLSYLYADAEVAEHLFRVAAGIDSLVIGEAQILGQLRRSFELARQLGTLGEWLSTLLNRAISFGRRVRTETRIGRGNVSVASVACRLAVQHLKDLSNKTLLVLGAGETAQLAGRTFAKQGVGKLLVLNRTWETARAMAAEIGGEAVPIDHLQSAIGRADLVVCAVGAPHYIMTSDGIGAIMNQRPERPLFLIDLSMPRNIDPAAEGLPGVSLYAIENLQEIARENRAQRAAEVQRVEEMVRHETHSFLMWANSSRQNQLVTELRRHVAGIQDRCLNRFCRHLPEKEKQTVARFTDSVLRACFHDVTAHVRDLDLEDPHDQMEYALIRRMFGLNEVEPEEFSLHSPPEEHERHDAANPSAATSS